ncbi:MAG: InlB B-repeat-containing protein, partial [Coriobacteriia bacterium]|nr:InlB B-repeat-containing protein [Coriobacteriia bacterium]
MRTRKPSPRDNSKPVIAREAAPSPSSRGDFPVIARSGEAATRQSSNLRATASKSAGRPRQSSNLRRRALMMVLSVAMLLQLIAPAATPQVASADTPSANNTTIATWVRTSSTMEQSGSEDFIKASNLPTYTDPVNGILRCKPNALCGQDITQQVEVRLDVNWREPIPGGTITFTVPYGTSAVTLAGDAITAANAASVSLQARGTAANQAAPGQPRICTITLKSDMTPSSMFNVGYTLTYTNGSQNFDGDTGDLTPHLNQSGTEIAVGEALSVTTACKSIFYPCLQLTSSMRDLPRIGPNPNFATDVIPFLSPTTAQTAKVGPTYVLSPGILTHMPDARADYTAAGGYYSASTPKTLKITVTLPAEATLAPTQAATFSNYDQSTVNIAGQDHIVLTTSATTGLSYAAFQSTIRPAAPNIAVIYTAPPAGGASSYNYDVKATGTWYDDSSFPEVESSNITQLYSTDVVRVNYTATAQSRVTYAPSPDYPGNSYTPTDYFGSYTESAYFALGDYTTLNYQLANNSTAGEAALDDVSYTIPFPSGDLLDISDFIVNSTITANPLVKDYLDKMIVTYSDNDSAAFSFDDPTIFSQTVTMNGGGTTLYPNGYVTTAAPANWIMNGKADSVYITQIKITQKQPLAYGDTVSFNFKAHLRNKRHSGPDIIPGTDTVQTQMTTTATPEDGTSTPQDKSATARTYPIYATTDDVPLGKARFTSLANFVGLASNTSAGVEIPVSNAIGYNTPSVNYNARVHNLTIWLAVPDYLQIDASSLTLSIGSGTASGVGSVPTGANLRQVPTSNAQIHPVDTSHAGVNLYAITYYGDLHALQDWYLRVDYKLIIPDGTPAKVNAPIQAFFTAEGVSGAWGLNGNSNLGDPYDLDGDGDTAANIMARQTTFTILVPSIISNTTVANGDQEASTTWKKDGFNIPSSPWAVSNLARAKGTATLRSTVSNGTGTSCSGTIYTALPSGDFTPSLTGVSLNQVSLVTGISAAASATYAYTTVTGTDPDLISSWTTFTDPADVPANATYLRFTGITLPPSTRVDVVTTYKIPDDAEQGEIVRANEVADLDTIDGRYYATTNSAGFVISKPSYIVNYYQDSVDSANLIGSSDEIDAVVGSTVDLASGTANGQLDFKRPPGYKEGKQQSAPFIVRDATGTIPDLATGNCNIIDVLYTNSVYTVHYDANGGTPSTYLDSDMLLWDSSGFLPTTSPERTGYTFNGWKSPDTDVIAGPSTPYSDLVADDSVTEVTLVADWTLNTYTVKYDANTIDTDGNTLVGTASGTMTDSTHSYNVAKTLTTNSYTHAGYSFAGWNSKADGTGTAYSDEQSVINLTLTNGATVTLYAQWTPLTDTVTYHGNTNTGGTEPASQNVKTGASFTVAAAGTLEKSGYTFTGWNTAANGSGTAYAASAVKTMPAGNLDLYAQWLEDSATPYTVYHYHVDGSGVADSTPFDTDNSAGVTGDRADAIAKTGLTGYTYDPNFAGTLASGVITGDGLLVLKLYYPV